MDIVNQFFFDIETAGRYKDYQSFKSADMRGALLFAGKYAKKQKQNTIDKQWQGTIDEAYIKNASLIPEYGRIVCISGSFYDQSRNLKVISINDDDEKTLIEHAEKVFTNLALTHRVLIGYNIKCFDMPWIYKKMLSYDISPPSNISSYGKKPWEISCIDFMELWKGTSWELSSFDEFTYALGIPSPKNDMDGTMVHAYYWNNRIKDIIKYCENDVIALAKIAKKLEKLI